MQQTQNCKIHENANYLNTSAVEVKLLKRYVVEHNLQLITFNRLQMSLSIVSEAKRSTKSQSQSRWESFEMTCYAQEMQPKIPKYCLNVCPATGRLKCFTLFLRRT